MESSGYHETGVTLMGIRWMYDAAFPPKNPPHWHVCAGYIGGNTPHAWTKDEWNAQWAPLRLPIFTANNRTDDAAAAHIDAGIIKTALRELCVPEGCVVCVDTETTVYTEYLSVLNVQVQPWHLMNYGSFSYVIRNPQVSAGRWAADWTDHIFDGVDLLGQDRIEAVQWANSVMIHTDYDASVIQETLPLWRKAA
jgi:hypothetical protein